MSAESQAETNEPSSDVVRGLIVANLKKLNTQTTTLAQLVVGVQKDIDALAKKVESHSRKLDGVEAGLEFEQHLRNVDET